MDKLESEFQSGLIDELEVMFPGCWITKGNSRITQGIPDLFILYKDRWAMLEVKRAANSVRQPNQEYYVDMFDGMSFAAFIYPDNRQEVLDALEQSFKPRRRSRVSQPK